MKRGRTKAKPLSRKDAMYIEGLLKEHEKTIHFTIYNTLSNAYKDLVEDAIGELCLAICENIQDLKNHDCPKAWLIVTAKYVTLKLIRERNREPDCLPLDEALLKADGTEVFEDVLYATWLKNGVPKKLMSLLSAREAEIYRKIYLEEKQIKHIAKELDITESTVRNVHKNLRDKIINAIKTKKF